MPGASQVLPPRQTASRYTGPHHGDFSCHAAPRLDDFPVPFLSGRLISPTTSHVWPRQHDLSTPALSLQDDYSTLLAPCPPKATTRAITIQSRPDRQANSVPCLPRRASP